MNYDFFLCSTPPYCLLWLHHAVGSMVGRWSSELCATFTMNVRCRVAICYFMLGTSKNFLLTDMSIKLKLTQRDLSASGV